MKDLKEEKDKQLKKIREKVYSILDDTYIFDKDKFTQKVIKETYLETKKELLGDLLKEWIKANIKETSTSDFFIYFEKKFRADFQKINYNNDSISSIK